MKSCVIGGAVVPAYVLLKDMSLVASGFFEQFFGASTRWLARRDLLPLTIS